MLRILNNIYVGKVFFTIFPEKYFKINLDNEDLFKDRLLVFEGVPFLPGDAHLPFRRVIRN